MALTRTTSNFFKQPSTVPLSNGRNQHLTGNNTSAWTKDMTRKTFASFFADDTTARTSNRADKKRYNGKRTLASKLDAGL